MTTPINPNDIKSFNGLLEYFRNWRSLDDPAVYDFGGIVHVMLACLDNMRSHAIEGEIADIGTYMTKEQIAFLRKITEAAENSAQDD